MNDRDVYRGESGRGTLPRPLDERPTTAGMTGFITALVALGLLVVVLVLYLMLQEEELLQENIERRRWMYYWFLILDVASFFAGLIASIQGGRSLVRSNTLYRGWGMAALIIGIMAMIVTLPFGLFMTCAAILLGANR
jgi:vacuolar-type H+-ATPase subunit I/STV1